jgi:hypothetical protein
MEIVQGSVTMLTHEQRYRELLNLVAAERAAHPLEFQYLEHFIFNTAHSRGLVFSAPPLAPHFSPDDANIDWQELVFGDGRVWIAHR